MAPDDHGDRGDNGGRIGVAAPLDFIFRSGGESIGVVARRQPSPVGRPESAWGSARLNLFPPLGSSSLTECPQLVDADIGLQKANAPFDPNRTLAGSKSRTAAVSFRGRDVLSFSAKRGGTKQ
jgi:hypothetical protein